MRSFATHKISVAMGHRSLQTRFSQPIGPRILQQPDGRQEPASLRNAGHFEVEDAIKPDNHSQAGEDLGIVLQRHSCEA